MQLEREMEICSSDITPEEVAQDMPLVQGRMQISAADSLELMSKFVFSYSS